MVEINGSDRLVYVQQITEDINTYDEGSCMWYEAQITPNYSLLEGRQSLLGYGCGH